MKHATPLGSESLAQAAVLRGLADALIVSGTATGASPDVESLHTVRAAVNAPLYIGSGLTLENATVLLPLVDGSIVGTTLKEGGQVDAPVDVERVRAMRSRFEGLGC